MAIWTHCPIRKFLPVKVCNWNWITFLTTRSVKWSPGTSITPFFSRLADQVHASKFNPLCISYNQHWLGA